jgi:hypothetical protein
MVRKIAAVFFLVLLLLVAGAYIVFKTQGDFVLRKFTEYVERTTGAPLRMDALPSLTVFPVPGLDVGQASWGGPEDEISVRFSRASARFSASALLSRRLEISSLRVEDLDLTVRPAPGRRPGGDSAGEERMEKMLASFPASLIVERGRIALSLPDGAGGLLSDADIRLDGLRSGAEASLRLRGVLESRRPDAAGPLELDAGVALSSRDVAVRVSRGVWTPTRGLPSGDPVSLTGNVRYSPRTGNLSLDGDLSLGAVKLDGPPADPGRPPQPAAQPATHEEEPGSVSPWPEVRLALSLDGLEIRGLHFRNIRARIDGKDGKYAVEPLTCDVLGGPVTASGTLAMAGPFPEIRALATADVSAPSLDLAQLTRLAGKGGVSGTARFTAALSADTSSPLTTLGGKGSLSAAPVKLDFHILPEGFPAPVDFSPVRRLDSAALSFTADQGILTLTDAALIAHGFKAEGKGTVNLPAASLDIRGTLRLAKRAPLPVRIHGPFSGISYGLDGSGAVEALDRAVREREGELRDDVRRQIGGRLRNLF